MSVSIPKGTRDFSPAETAKRKYIFDTISEVFNLFGYSQIETPAMENLSTLTGKYGEEGDKLLFKILNSGNFLQGLSTDLIADSNSNKIAAEICDKGLRYDLTVPFARYVVQHKNEIVFPFKRYQIQPVWRADRPQKGRYREFYQCDADVVGSTSLLNEVELLQIIAAVFDRLNIKVTVKLNNRKILSGIAEVMNCADKLIEITIAIDKIEKIGIEAVISELLLKGISNAQIEILKPVLTLGGSNLDKLEKLSSILSGSGHGMEGIREISEILKYADAFGLGNNLELDLSLARGLNYYTGAIIEVKANGVEMGSICGGGRYDNLTGIFGLKNVSGVGISFGADRIYDVLGMLNLYPESLSQSTKVMFCNMGVTENVYAIKAALELRKIGISVEVYPDSTKLKKQFEYADKKNIPFVIVAGDDEVKTSQYTIKNMRTQEQITTSLLKIIDIIN